jgi:hypothetical protein
LLVNDGTVERGPHGSPIEGRLNFIDRLFGTLEFCIGRSQRRLGLLIVLAADCVGLNQRGTTLFIGKSLGPNRFHRSHGRLGLLQLGLQVRVVQSHQNIVGFHLLPSPQIDFDHACQQLRTNGHLAHRTNRPHGRLDDRQ